MILIPLFYFFILCKSTQQCIKNSQCEIFEKFQCENFIPRKFHEVLHLYVPATILLYIRAMLAHLCASKPP